MDPSSAASAAPLIRCATPEDAPALARLRFVFRMEQAGHPSSHEDEAAFIARCTDWMATRLADPHRWRCWVAARDGEPVGHVWVQFIDKLPNPLELPERIAYLTNFYVKPDARGGTGSHLLAACLDGCHEAGVERVILWPTAASRSIYLRHGFAPPDDLLELTLGRAWHG